jgi:hypothetical protein
MSTNLSHTDLTAQLGVLQEQLAKLEAGHQHDRAIDLSMADSPQTADACILWTEETKLLIKCLTAKITAVRNELGETDQGAT